MTSQRPPKRGRQADPAAWDAVAFLIVPFLASPRDILAFLTALPTLDEQLTALTTLLATSRTFGAQWPTIALEELDVNHQLLGLTALPALASLAVCRPSMLAQHVGHLLGPHGRRLRAALAASRPKIVRLDWCVDQQTLGAIQRALPSCTALECISADVAIIAELLPLLPRSVRRLSLVGSPTGVDLALWRTAAVAVAQWLDTSLCPHLGVKGIHSALDGGVLACILASTLSLESVDIEAADPVLDALVAANEPLSHVTRLRLVAKSYDLSACLHLFDVTKLTALTIDCGANGSWLLRLLPRMVALETLSLRRCMMHEDAVMALGTNPRLTTLALCKVNFATASHETFFTWTCGLTRLETVVLTQMNLSVKQYAVFKPVFAHWIGALRVSSVVFDNCALSAGGIVAIAAGLQRRCDGASASCDCLRPLVVRVVDTPDSFCSYALTYVPSDAAFFAITDASIFEVLAGCKKTTLELTVVDKPGRGKWGHCKRRILDHARTLALRVDKLGAASYRFQSL